jgi:hypothetical protein
MNQACGFDRHPPRHPAIRYNPDMKRIVLVFVMLGLLATTRGAPRVATPKYAFIDFGQSNAFKISKDLQAALTAKYGPATLLILCTKGSTPIADFVKDTPIYRSCLTKIRAAVAKGYVVAKFFMYQGEQDTYTSGLTSRYWEDQFLKIVSDLRADSGSPFQVYIFQIGENPHPTHLGWSIVQRSQQQTVIDHPDFTLISTMGVPLCPPNGPHHCPEGYKTITNRLLAVLR